MPGEFYYGFCYNPWMIESSHERPNNIESTALSGDEPVIGNWVSHCGKQFHRPGKTIRGHMFSYPELVEVNNKVVLIGFLPDRFTRAVLDPHTGEPLIKFPCSQFVLGVEADGIILSKGPRAERVFFDGTSELIEVDDTTYESYQREKVLLEKEDLAGGMTMGDVQARLGSSEPPELAFYELMAERRNLGTPHAIDALTRYEDAADVEQGDSERVASNRQARVAESVRKVLQFVQADVSTSPNEADGKAELLKVLALEAQTRGVLPDPEAEANLQKVLEESYYSQPDKRISVVDLEIAEMVMDQHGGTGQENVREYLGERMIAAENNGYVSPRTVDIWGIESIASAIELQVERGTVPRESSPYAIDHGTPYDVSPLAQEHAAERLSSWREADTKPIEYQPLEDRPRPKTVGEAWAEKVAWEQAAQDNSS